MKKIILFFLGAVLLAGCDNNSNQSLINELNKKVETSKNYQITAELEIFRNEEKFVYDIVSTYKKSDYFKVELINKKNNHKQIILKDTEFVYVLTPSLKKCFKFQSEWPYNNSQIYLLQPIILDVNNDSNSELKKEKDGYIVISNVNYSSEKDFKKQKIYFDAEKNLKKIEVVDKDNNIKMSMKIINIEYNLKLESNFFDIKEYQKDIDKSNQNESKGNSSNENTNDKSSNSLNDVVYPMYVPTDTYLSAQDIVATDSGERVILTFTGDSTFTIIQENLDGYDTHSYVYGEPYLILDTVGVITDDTLSWISNNIEYSVISDTLSVDELVTVAQSISVEPVGK